MTDILQEEEKQQFNESDAANINHFAKEVYNESSKRNDK
jgi:hypothetical protein